jgi:hypothetical protein
MASDSQESWTQKIDEAFKKMVQEEHDKSNLSDEKVGDKLKKVVREIEPEYSSRIYSTLKTDMPRLIKSNARARTLFETRLCELWKDPLDMSEALLKISIEIGEDINTNLRSGTTRNESILIDVLTRLHGQACLIGSEILTLMRSGYADGANARWRSLYEVVVFARFIKKNGSDVAERYLNHNVIESHKALAEYQKYQQRLGLEPIEASEIESITEKRQQLIEKYGEPYKHNYGWAASVLKNPNPNFTDIEKANESSHFRPYYRLASHHIHSNPKSILFKLGTSTSNTRMILVGPSNAGLAEPGQGMAISLGQIDALLIGIEPNITGIMIQKVINRWVEELCQKYIEVHKIVENHWAKGKE